MSDQAREENFLTSSQLVTLACLIHSGAVEPEQYISWSEKTIIETERPPYWILQLAVEHNPRAATLLLLDEAKYVMDGRWHILEVGHLEIAFVFVRYQHGICSWEAFLRGAINIAKRRPSQWSAHDFERFLDAYLSSGTNSSLAYHQAQHMEGVLDEEIAELASLDPIFPLEV